MTTINILIILALAAIFWKVSEVKKEQYQLTAILNALHDTLNLLIDHANHGEEKEMNTIKALQEICITINQAMNIGGQFMNHTTFSLQNIAVCMIPFIDRIKNEAIEADNYEAAQECITIINNLKEIIKSK